MQATALRDILLSALLLGGACLCADAARGQEVAAPAVVDEPEAERPTTAEIDTFALDAVSPGLLAAGGRFDARDPDIIIGLRAGVELTPAYFGSDELRFGPDLAARFDYVLFPGGFEFGSGQTVGFRTGLGVRGSVRYIRKRDSDDYEQIRGLDNVDTSFEAGLGLGYEERHYRVFADVRYGFFGHNGWVGEIGADGIAYPISGLTLTLGPRLALGDQRFTDAYFGVSAEEARRSDLDEFDPDGGLVGAGVTLGARYLLNERWGVEGAATYERLLNDAADSPVTDTGSPNQYSVRVGVTRRISLDF